jgi:hypothetical protein
MEVGICVTILNTDHNNLVWSIHSGRLLDVTSNTCIIYHYAPQIIISQLRVLQSYSHTN